MRTNILHIAKNLLITGLFFFVGVGILQAAGSWTSPSVPAPGGNVDAPIHAGLDSQSKLGQLMVNTDTANPFAIGLVSFGKTVLNGAVQINSGTPQVGQVLSAVDAQGNLGWATPSIGTGPGTSPGVYTFTAPAGSTGYLYNSLMNNAEFRTWYTAQPGGAATIRPAGNAYRGDEGWGSTQATASKLCQFFTDGVALKYTTAGLGSDNNNSWAYWDTAQSKWRWSYSGWVNSYDITEIQCMTTSGIVRGASFATGGSNLPPYGIPCETYWCIAPPPSNTYVPPPAGVVDNPNVGGTYGTNYQLP